MDSEKDYSVVSCLVNGTANWVISKQYSDYRLVSGNWVPTTILLERYEAGSNRLLARDLWDITAVDSNAPEADSFNVDYETDALVEYVSDITVGPVMYRHSPIVDTDMLLAKRFVFAASEGSQPQNCATAALKYTISRLGKDVTDSQLAQLVSEPNNNTSLYAMKQLVEDLGVYCRAVKTDIQTLRSLVGCEVILHIPGKNHFVVLAGIDDKYVWCIDLTNNKFFYRTDINFFDMDWSEGTALIMSEQSIQIQGSFIEIDDIQLGGIIGADGYSCTRLLQEYGVIYCSYVGGECLGYYYEFYERWGCEAAESGSCSSSVMLRYKKSPCILDPYYLDGCTVTGEWTCYYMRACA
jgi:hypothetical protein